MWLLVLELLFFEADSESEICACIDKAIHQRLKVWWPVCCYCGIVCKQQVCYYGIFTSVVAFEREGLKSLLPVRVGWYIHSSAVLKTCLRSSEWKILGPVWHRTWHHWYFFKGSDIFTFNFTVPHILLWKNSIIIFNFSGHPILVRFWTNRL